MPQSRWRGDSTLTATEVVIEPVGKPKKARERARIQTLTQMGNTELFNPDSQLFADDVPMVQAARERGKEAERQLQQREEEEEEEDGDGVVEEERVEVELEDNVDIESGKTFVMFMRCQSLVFDFGFLLSCSKNSLVLFSLKGDFLQNLPIFSPNCLERKTRKTSPKKSQRKRKRKRDFSTRCSDLLRKKNMKKKKTLQELEKRQ